MNQDHKILIDNGGFGTVVLENNSSHACGHQFMKKGKEKEKNDIHGYKYFSVRNSI